MVTYSRVWDALTTPAEADELQASAELLYALQQLISRRRWSTEETAHHLQLDPVRAGRLIAGDINEFTADELRALAAATQATPPPTRHI
ncbi:XRE family transcriptional regulator [Mycobacterium hubeiense]|uniref:XRE family transcriptional regulator n=1 Tax=Mycobacterium hubeiense TaxID=1867256 RepID=UPI000C7ECD00|nr:XRE family transcriptional regulator [Mycobacterium sp. QGD 101]